MVTQLHHEQVWELMQIRDIQVAALRQSSQLQTVPRGPTFVVKIQQTEATQSCNLDQPARCDQTNVDQPDNRSCHCWRHLWATFRRKAPVGCFV